MRTRGFYWWMILVWLVCSFAAASEQMRGIPYVVPESEKYQWGLSILGLCVLAGSYILRYGFNKPSRKNDVTYNAEACAERHASINRILGRLEHQIEELWKKIDRMEERK